MKYFNDINFILAKHSPQYKTIVTDYAPNVCSFEFNASERMYFKKDDNPRVELKSPHVFWLEPGHVYSYGPISKTRNHAFFTFSGTRATRIIQEGFNEISQCGYSPILQVESFSDVYYKTVEIVKRKNMGELALATINLEWMLHHVAADSAMIKANISIHTSEIKSLAKQMKTEPLAEYNLDEIARKRLSMSRRNFNRVFKNIVNQSPYNYLLNCRMHAAAKVLATEGGLVGEIAFQFGFATQEDFSRQFKKIIGCSPKNYMNSLNRI